MTGLKALYLEQCPRLQPLSLHSLRGLTNLQTLELINCRFPFAGRFNLATLLNLPRLKSLVASRSDLSDPAALAALKRLTGVVNLNLEGSLFKDIAVLGGMSQLETLNLSDTDVTDIAPLAGFRNLRLLNISGCPVTRYPLTAFTILQAMPSLKR